jgi:hypothetical protein
MAGKSRLDSEAAGAKDGPGMVMATKSTEGRPVHESPYHRVQRREGHLRMTRTAEPYPDLAALEDEYRTLVGALTAHRGHDLGLLVDLRDAKGRNDPGFEQTLARWRRKSLEGYQPLVILVRSALGRMHVERHMKADGLDAIVVTDEAQALRAVGDRVSGVVSQERP